MKVLRAVAVEQGNDLEQWQGLVASGTVSTRVLQNTRSYKKSSSQGHQACNSTSAPHLGQARVTVIRASDFAVLARDATCL